MTLQSNKKQKQLAKMDKSIPKADEINENYRKIDNAIDGLDGKVWILLKNQENDFFQACNKHMQQVKKEMDFLRDKAEEEGSKKARDKMVKQLEDERDWFR